MDVVPRRRGDFYCREDLIQTLHPAVIGWLNVVDPTKFDEYRFELQPNTRRFEPGTHNVAGILALGASIDMLLETGVNRIWNEVDGVTPYLCERLERRGHAVFSPRSEEEKNGIVSFTPVRVPDPPTALYTNWRNAASSPLSGGHGCGSARTSTTTWDRSTV